MAITFTERLNIPIQDIGATGWGAVLNTGFQEIDDRLFLTGDGDPTGVATSQYVGQRYYDTTNDIWYYATASGVDNTWVFEAFDDAALVRLDASRVMTAGLRHPNDTYLEFRNVADDAWMPLLGLDGFDYTKVGCPQHPMRLLGDSLANMIVQAGGAARRMIVADVDDKNDADLILGFDFTDPANWNLGTISTVNSNSRHLVTPYSISGDPLVINFGHAYPVTAAGEIVTLSQAYNTVHMFGLATISPGPRTGMTPGNWAGVEYEPTSNSTCTLTTVVGSTVCACYWFSMGY